LKDWIQYHKIGPKTAALLLWSFAGKETTVPVDSHVFTCMRALGLTNAKSEDECSWQLQQYAPKGSFIQINNSIGAMGQTMATPAGRRRVIAATNRVSTTTEVQVLMCGLRDIYARRGKPRHKN
jgi:endonuclease III